MREIIIYTLRDEFNIKYIGKTTDLKKRYYRHIFDARTKKHLNKKDAWIKSLLNKEIKPIIEILDIVPESEWIFWEKYWISQFKTWDFNLKNLTDGGDGLTGHKISDETKLKMSLSKKGKLPKNLKQLKNLVIIDEVSQYDLNGNLIKIWESVYEAKKILKIDNINLVVNKIRDTAGGYIWRYKKDVLSDKEIFIINNKIKKPVLQLSYKGELIKEWKTISEAKKIYKHISAVLAGKRKSTGGCLWKYKNI